FGNGTNKTMQYDSRYRPQENKLVGPAGMIADYTYTEDSTGNIVQIHDAVDPNFNRDFGYDDLNRLTIANSGNSLWGLGKFAYDSRGVRTITFVQATLATLSIDPALVTGGSSATGTVTLTSAATPDGVPISLSSMNGVIVPATVVIPSGSTSATFTITTPNV